MKTKIQAVIFDMDGLMFDTESLFSIVHSEIAEKRGKKFTLELKSKMMGQKALHAVEILLDGLGLHENAEDVLREQTVRYVELLKTESRAMPGLFEFIEFLEQWRLRKGIATSSIRPWVDILLDKFKIKNSFEFIITGDQVKRGKPHPDLYLKAVKAVNLPAHSCLVLEDASNGVRAAKAAGCFTVAVPSQFTRNQDFARADLIVDGLMDKKLIEAL